MLEIDALSVRYGGALVLSEVSLTVAPGAVTALMGRNGAGKSTLMLAAMGLLRDVSGSVRFEGRELLGRPPHAIAAAGIGFVPEERRIFRELTVQENLETGRRGQGWTEERLFVLFPNLAERRHALGKHLSGGEQQMLAIARTLMGNPKLLLLDEPSEGVAPVIVQALARTVQALKGEGLSILMSEQNLRFARSVSDRAVVLAEGRSVWTGDFAALDADSRIAAAHLAV